MFPDIAYLDWIAGRPEEAEHDLGSSDLRRAAPSGDGVVPPALADLPTPDATAAERLAAIYGVDAENVLVTAGATHANFLAVAAALSETAPGTDAGSTAGGDTEKAPPGDRVLVESPGYEPLVATPRGLGATVDRFDRPAGEGYPLDPDRVAAAVTGDTALVVASNRHNPSGRRVGRDALAATARAVAAASDGADARTHLLVDEVYAPFGTDPGDGPSGTGREDGQSGPDPGDDLSGIAREERPFGGPTAAGLRNAVITSSLTKFFGFGGVRLGWLVADAEFVARARSAARHVPAVADPSERLARRALARADRFAEESRERVRANCEALSSFVADRRDLAGGGLAGGSPTGGGLAGGNFAGGGLAGRSGSGCPYAFLEHESADGTAVAEAAWEAGVLVVPGRFFGDPDRFRVAACGTPEAVRAGLDAFGDVLDGLSAR